MKKLFFLTSMFSILVSDPLVCLFTDLDGNLRGVTIPEQEKKSAFKRGLTVDGSSLPGCTNINQSDLILKLDSTSLRKQNGTSYVFCDLFSSNNEPFYACSRGFLKNSLNLINSLNAELVCGAEIEFYLVNKDGTPIDNLGYFAIDNTRHLRDFPEVILTALWEAGIAPEKCHHEVSPGQYEVSLRYSNALKIADDIILTRYVVEKVASDFGFKAVFSPKPFTKFNGSGMHIHFSLTSNGKNVFAGENGELSEVAQKFIAGNLKYIKDLALLTNFSEESYKRLVPGFEAPVLVCWGQKNRSAMIRQPLFHGVTEEEIKAGSRAEIRNPDCHNPYLALGALAISGFAGIKENLVAPEQVNTNLYAISQEKLIEMGIDSLPKDFAEALEKFAKVSVEGLSPELQNQIIALKGKTKLH